MKTFRYLFAILAVTLMLAACKKEEQQKEYFNIDTTDVVLADSEEGSTDVLLATNREPVAMVEENAQTWLSAEISRRCLTLSYQANREESERTGHVVIEAGNTVMSVTVTQPAYVPPIVDPEPPEEDTYEIYDLYYENDVPAGVVFWTSEDKKSALVVSLTRTETFVPWSYSGENVIGTGADDGMANMALLRASVEAESIPAIEFCDGLGEGWYWPAIAEMTALFGVYDGREYAEGGHNVKPAELPEEQKAARAKFDKILVDAGGVALNTMAETENGDQYWTSTEQTHTDGVTYGSSVRFGKGYVSGAADQMNKTKATRYVRAFKAVPYTGEVGPGPGPDEPVVTKFPVYKENGKAVGIVYWTSEDGKTSKVLSLQRSDASVWSYDGDTQVGCADKEDGAANMAIIKANAAVADNIPALGFCESLGEGWYWPAINELRVIFEVYNGKPYEEKGNVPASEISDEEKEARAAFDLSLTTYGGVAMNLQDPTSTKGDRYWSSTEYTYKEKYYGSFMQFGKAYMSGPADTPGKTQSDGRYIRAIKVISNE